MHSKNHGKSAKKCLGKYQDMDSAWWNEKIPMHRKIRDRDDRDKEGDGD